MKLKQFRVRNYRNIIDSGPIDVTNITAIVGQNESGKSNLCDALFRLNPFDGKSAYNIHEDWPADKWGDRDDTNLVCEATFLIDDADEIAACIEKTAKQPEPVAPAEGDDAPTPPPVWPKELAPRGPFELRIGKRYNGAWVVRVPDTLTNYLDVAKVEQWAKQKAPKCVFISEYQLSGAQTELNQLAERNKQQGWANLTPQDQAILVVLSLAKIDIDDFIKKGQSPEGRTLRAFDKRQASAYLTQQFAKLWEQKDVKFDIEIDATTLNIFVEDVGFGMPVRLNRRSTGFRWYVSFAWLFTHATKGEYQNCVLLLEEPGIHLHHAGHRDLLKLFERLAASNTIVYTTHIATMLDAGFPERVRIAEVKDHHATVVNGMVSNQKQPMMVIEARLGLSGAMSGLLGSRQTLIVEGGDDAIILQKLSGILTRAKKVSLSERVYLFPAHGASKTPMYAGFLIGHKWDAGVLLDSDEEGEAARKKIGELYPQVLATDSKFRTFMLGKAAGISKNEAAIEDIFPDEFYLECVNAAYGLAIQLSDLPPDGSPLITKRVEHVLKTKHARSELDRSLVMGEMLRKFDTWTGISDLPSGTAERAEKLFSAINKAFA